MAGSQLVKRFQLRTMRNTFRRACSTNRPGVAKIRKRSFFGRALSSSGGKAKRFNPVRTLCVITANRIDKALFALKQTATA